MEPIRLDGSIFDVVVAESNSGHKFLVISADGIDKARLSPKATFHLQQIIGNRLDVKTVTTYELNSEL